jgi:protein-disulfide isomerase
MKRPVVWGVLTVFLLMVCFSLPAIGADPSAEEQIKALRQELDSLKQEVKSQQSIHDDLTQIRKQLEEIKGLVQTRPAAAPTPPPPAAPPAHVTLSVDQAPFQGEKDAKVTLVEFTDFQCPFCGRHFKNTLPQIETDYVKTGKIKYVLLDFPIESLHPNAFKAAEAAHCAGEQGKYWEMHDQLFENQRALDPTKLPDYAKAAGLDLPKFNQCLDSGKYADRIRQEQAEAQKAGVNGTPSFFLGYTEPDGKTITSEQMLVGAQPYPAFKSAIDGLLSSKK